MVENGQMVELTGSDNLTTWEHDLYHPDLTEPEEMGQEPYIGYDYTFSWLHYIDPGPPGTCGQSQTGRVDGRVWTSLKMGYHVDSRVKNLS